MSLNRLAALGLLAACQTECPPEPFRAPSSEPWMAVRVGISHTCGLTVGSPYPVGQSEFSAGEVRCWGAAPTGDAALPLLDNAPRGRHWSLAIEHTGDTEVPELACAYGGGGGTCWGRETLAPVPVLSVGPAGGEACAGDGWLHCYDLSTLQTPTWVDLARPILNFDFGPGLLATIDYEAGTLGVQLHEWDEAATAVPDGVWTRVAQGGKSGALCAIRDSGSLHCWRAVEGPDLAIADTPDGEYDDVCLFTGLDAACALDTDGRATCWGDDAPESPTRRYAALSCGHTSVCGQLEDGRLQCWGACEHGECDVPE